ncbi:TPA: hypothetical protein DCX15_05945 [bacterium]|nr:hypothetical protein [bacterium]
MSGTDLISELTIDKNNWDGSDWAITKDFVGIRIGLLAPHHLIVISARLYHLLKKHNAKGFAVERVHLL